AVQMFTLFIVCGTVGLDPALPNAVVGEAYSAKLTTFGDSAPKSFAIVHGELPPGLTLDTSTGVVHGTPTSGSGVYDPVLEMIAGTGCRAGVPIHLRLFRFTPDPLPAAVYTVAYSQAITVAGGTGAITLQLTGDLPPGLEFADGVISGTATDTGSFPISFVA